MNNGSLLIPGLIIIVVLLATAMLISFEIRGRNRKRVAVEGVQRVGGRCAACGGTLEPGDVLSGDRVFHFRGAGKIRAIGAARCAQCGHVQFFA